MTDATLERASQGYRNGYRDGEDGREKRTPSTGIAAINDDTIGGTIKPFADFDYNSGYAAGANDARWRRIRAGLENARAEVNAWRIAHGKQPLPVEMKA